MQPPSAPLTPSLAPSLTAEPESAAIANLDQPVLQRYFDTVNTGDFEATGRLFAADGALKPPFDPAIVGAEAIAAYLQKEAQGLQLQPHEATSHLQPDGCTEYQVVGKVQTPFFKIHVAWQFVVTPQQEICLAKIKLLASMQELAKLRR